MKAELKERLGVEPGDLLLFVADKEAVVATRWATARYLGRR